MIILSRCLDCKNFIDNKKFTCRAFPDGIPDNILFNKIKHNKKIKGQTEEYIYEPIEEEGS